MELSSSNIKKILIFLKMKPCTLRSQALTFFPKKISFVFFLKKSAPEKFLIFSYISWNETPHFQSKHKK